MSFEQRIQKDSERFQALINRLADTQWSEMAMADAQSRLTTCERQIQLIQNKINAFHTIVDKEHKHFIEMKKHSIRHVWYKVQGTLEQCLNEQETTWLREMKKCKEEEENLIRWNAEMATAQKHLQQCQDSYEQYTTSKRALNDLLNYFFSSIIPTYSDEDTLKQCLKKKEERLIALQNDNRILKHIYHLLKKATRFATVSHRALHDALTKKTSGWISYWCFGNMFMGSYLSKARDASYQAQELLNEAKSAYSNVLLVDRLPIMKDKSICNIAYGHIWIDANMGELISERSNQMTSADVVLMSILSEIKEQMEICEADRNQTNQDIKQLTVEHFNTRINIVQNIIKS